MTRSILWFPLLVALITPAIPARGMCGLAPSVTEARDQADLVFEGVVKRQIPMLLRASDLPNANPPFEPVTGDRSVLLERTEFTVSRIWKGTAVGLVTLVGEFQERRRFSFGQRYIVYANTARSRADSFTTSLCSVPSLSLEQQIVALGNESFSAPEIEPAQETTGQQFIRRIRLYWVSGRQLILKTAVWSWNRSDFAAQTLWFFGILAFITGCLRWLVFRKHPLSGKQTFRLLAITVLGAMTLLLLASHLNVANEAPYLLHETLD